MNAGWACGVLHPERHLARTLDELRDRTLRLHLIYALLTTAAANQDSDYCAPVLVDGCAWLVEVWTNGSARIMRPPAVTRDEAEALLAVAS